MCDCSFGDPENPETSKTAETNKLSFPPFLFFSQTVFLRSPSLHIPTIHLHLIPTFYAKPSPLIRSCRFRPRRIFTSRKSRQFCHREHVKPGRHVFFSLLPAPPFLLTTSQPRLLRGNERKCPLFSDICVIAMKCAEPMDAHD